MQRIKPEELLEAYRSGRFPMAENKEAEEVQWHRPRRRGIIPVGEFHASKNLKRFIRNTDFTVDINRDFKKVMQCCADRDWSWINDTIIDVYCKLHKQGYAHSVEIYNTKGRLVGGQYGVAIGAAFFGESMFRYEKNADKMSLYYCHEILKNNGFTLWDNQLYSKHMAQFGAIRVWRWTFNRMLTKALKKECEFVL